MVGFGWAARSGRLAGWMNRRPEKVAIELVAADSFWPGLVEVEGLVVRGQTPRIDWEVELERGRGQLALLPLLARRVVFRAIEAQGVTVKTRRRRAEGEPAAEHAPALRPLPARSAPREVSARGEGASSPRPSRWSFEFRNVRVDDVREVVLDESAFSGRASGRGGFAIRSGDGVAQIFPSEIELDGVELRYQGEPLGRALGGRLELEVEPWRYREVRGRALLPHISGRAALAGTLDDGALTGELLRRAPWVEVNAQQVPLEADLRLERGRLRDGSKLTIAAAPRRIGLLDFAIDGVYAFELTVADGLFSAPEVHWSATFDDFRVRFGAEPEPLLVGSGLALVGRSRDADLSRLAETTELSVELGRARLPDLRRLAAWLPPSSELELLEGSGEVDGRAAVRLSDRALSGKIALRFEPARLRWADLELGGRITSELVLAGGDLEARRFDVTGTRLELSDFTAPKLATKTTATPIGWWADVSLGESELALGPPVSLAGEFSARMRDTGPLVAFLELRRDLPSWAERALTVEKARATGRFRARPGLFNLEELATAAFGAQLRARLDFAGAERRGKLLVSWRRLAIGVGLVGNERKVHLRDAEEWFAER